MALKSVARSATVAFAPTAIDVLATGTMAGAIDLAFSTSASLDVFKVDFASPDPELPLLNSYSASEKFNRLSWGTAGAGGEEYPYGLIAGGHADGSIGIWNPAPFISNDQDSESSLLAKMQKHTAHVRGLEFNVITPNLLASGGDDGEINIWDLVNPSSPSHFPPLKAQGQTEISYVSWNRKVGHILASTSYSGLSVVWDLKRQKPVLSFTDPNSRRRCSVLQWNPEVATQLIVASDDDRSPSLQVWDLRNSVSPVKELLGHTKGVLAMAWCPIDSTFLLSCAKDNRTLCWDTSSGEIICELPVSNNWNFDVQWSPRIAGVLSTSSFDGRVNLYNIEACSRMLPSEGVFGGSLGATTYPASMRAPKWLKRPVGVNFGFGGKLVSFGYGEKKEKGPSGPSAIQEITIRTVITEEDFINRSKEFEAAIEDPSNKSSLRNLCEKKAQTSSSEEEKEIWSFLKIMFEENARTSLLGHLGFVVQTSEQNYLQEDKSIIKDLNTEMAQKLDLVNGNLETQEVSGLPNVPQLGLQGDPSDDGTDFFNNLSTPKGQVSPEILPVVEKEVEESTALNDAEQVEADDEDDCDRAVQHALVIGDFKEAVKHCLYANRMADALVLALVGGPDLYEKTLREHIRKSHRRYKEVMAAVVARDVGNLVDSRPLAAWKETLALLCSFAESQDWSILCDTLAAKLDAAGSTQAAILCYICAANVEEVVKIWCRELMSHSTGDIFMKLLQDVMEKMIVLALAKGQKRVAPSLTRLLASYADLLASQGISKTALEYLDLVVPEEAPEELLILRDRIYKSEEGQRKQESTVASQAVSSVGQNVSGYDGGQNLAAHPPLENYPAYPSQEATYQPTQPTQPTYYQGAPQDQIKERSYTPTPTPEAPYSQTGMFFPTPPSASQVPSTLHPTMHHTAFAPPPPPPVKLPATTDPSSLAKFMPPSSNQFFTATNASQPVSAMMVPGPNPAITAAPPPQTFMPVSAPRASVVQQSPSMLTPAMAPQSPSSISTPTSLHSSAPPVVAPNLQTADTSNVAADLKPVVATILRLFNETAEALGGPRANPAKKREMEDNSKKLGILFTKLNAADISPTPRAKLIQLCQSLDAGDYSTALQLQVSLTTSYWDECGTWLTALKRLIKSKQTLR